MNRGVRIGMCLSVLLTGMSLQITQAATAGKPNIVFILADDAAYSNFGFSAKLNNVTSYAQTPNLDALAAQGVIGAQAYVGHSICGPSRYDLLTGLYSQRAGYETNVANWSVNAVNGNVVQGVDANAVMLPQRLKDLGYSTGMMGKWHEGYQQGLNTPTDKGFDEFYGFLAGDRSYYPYPSTYYDDSHGLWKNNQYYEPQWRSQGDPSLYDPTHGRYLTDALGEEGVNYINRHANDSNPFFLYMSFTATHTPWDYKQSDYDHFSNLTDPTQRTLAAMTYALDRQVGALNNALKANGLADNTIIVFANDNGADTYVGNPPNTPFTGWKGTVYEGGIRVPFFMKGPGLPAGTVYNSPITMLDMVPTLVDAAGGDASQFQHDGYDVMPYLTGQATDDPNKVWFWRNFTCYAVRKGNWKLEDPVSR